MKYVIAYKESMVRDAQVFLGDPEECDPLSSKWTDVGSVEVLAGVFEAADRESALEQAAKTEGCHKDALCVVAEFQ